MVKKPRYQELLDNPNRNQVIDDLLSRGVIDFKYLAGLNNFFNKEMKKALIPRLPDKERPSRDFVLLSALAVLDGEMNPKEAMEYSAKYLNKPKGYVEAMKHELFRDVKNVVKDLNNHPYKRVIMKYRHWQGNLYRKANTPSKLTNSLYRDVSRTKYDEDMENRVKLLETRVSDQEIRIKFLEDSTLSKSQKMELAKDLKLSGWSYKDLMQRFEISKRTLQRWLYES